MLEVFKYKGSWTYDCHVCGVGGAKYVDQPNAFWEAEQHYIMAHTDLHPWEY